MGNLLVQAVALGRLEPKRLRRVVAASCTRERYEPEQDWQVARERFAALRG